MAEGGAAGAPAPPKTLISAYEGRMKRKPQSEVPQIDDWLLPGCSVAFHLAPVTAASVSTTTAAIEVGGLPHVLSVAVCSTEAAAAQLSRSLKIRTAIQGFSSLVGLLIWSLPFVNTMTLFTRFIGQDTFMSGFFGFNAPTFGEGALALELAALVGGRPMLAPHQQSRAHGFYNVFLDVTASASAKTPQTTAAALGSALFGCAVRTCSGMAMLMFVFNAQRMPDAFYAAGAVPRDVTAPGADAPFVFPFVVMVGTMVAMQLVLVLLLGCVFTPGRVTIALVWIFLMFPIFTLVSQ
jgi:hypothetical protein